MITSEAASRPAGPSMTLLTTVNPGYNWHSLRLLDFRDRNTPASIAEGCFEHLRVSSNGGRLRSVISVFAPRTPTQPGPGRAGPRIFNPQLIRYAGYQTTEGVLGDPQHLALTQRFKVWAGTGRAPPSTCCRS